MATKYCASCDKTVTVMKDRVTCQRCGADLLHKCPTRTADAVFQDIRQMLVDWRDATPEQRAEALRLAALSGSDRPKIKQS